MPTNPYQPPGTEETHTIYVYLEDEGVDVWRPVQAVRTGESTFQILGPIPEYEVWQFQPGENVCCNERVFEGGSKVLCTVGRAT
jgi:hypothetical protein